MNKTVDICSVCHQTILPEYYFCPNCGNNLKEILKPVPIINQIGLYLLAILLPPLGLWPGIKYLMKKGKQPKWVGAITIVLTLISTVLVIMFTFKFLNDYLSQISQYL